MTGSISFGKSREYSLVRTVIKIFCLLMFIFLADSANAQPRKSTDFISIAPDSWRLTAPSPKSNERRFVSPRGDAWLSLYAVPAGNEPIESYKEHVKDIIGGEITYQRQGKSWIVVSGYIGNRIFYRKAMMACENRQWHHLDFEYPAAQKEQMDLFVTRASYALSSYDEVGCPSAHTR